MNIAICIDENFVMQAGVFITSIKTTNKNVNINIYVLSEFLSDNSKNSLNTIVSGSNITLSFIKIDLSTLPPLPLEGKSHISTATYYRILLPFILPQNIEKILYLDCDMLVLDDLEPLYDSDISSLNAATTLDMFNDDKRINERLMYSLDAGYFNAGMILMNLKNWRKNKISERAIEFIGNYPEKCWAHDQDALNHALNGSYLPLSARYNMQLDFFCDHKFLIVDESHFKDIDQSRKNPCIIHFTGPTKPWLKNCNHPYIKLWDYFQGMTEWRDLPKKYEFRGCKLLKYFIKQLLKSLHLFKEKKFFLPESYIHAESILCLISGLRHDNFSDSHTDSILLIQNQAK